MNRVRAWLFAAVIGATPMLVVLPARGAANWVPIGVTEQHGKTSQMYVDANSITPKEKYLRAWIMHTLDEPDVLDYKAGSAAGKSYRSVVQLYYFDCRDKEVAQGGFSLFSEKDGTGSVIYSEEVPFSKISPTAARPGSSGEYWLTLVCTPAPKPAPAKK